jgi:hypothetical protein
MVFKTWFSRLGISTLGPEFSHRGFRVAFGHGHPLVIIKARFTMYVFIGDFLTNFHHKIFKKKKKVALGLCVSLLV